MNTPAQLRFRFPGSSWLMVKSINTSKYGELVTASMSSINPDDRVQLIRNQLTIKEVPADIQFFSMTGQLIFSKKNVIGEVLLPAGIGIVKVVQHDFAVSLKKLKH